MSNVRQKGNSLSSGGSMFVWGFLLNMEGLLPNKEIACDCWKGTMSARILYVFLLSLKLCPQWVCINMLVYANGNVYQIDMSEEFSRNFHIHT